MRPILKILAVIFFFPLIFASNVIIKDNKLLRQYSCSEVENQVICCPGCYIEKFDCYDMKYKVENGCYIFTYYGNPILSSINSIKQVVLAKDMPQILLPSDVEDNNTLIITNPFNYSIVDSNVEVIVPPDFCLHKYIQLNDREYFSLSYKNGKCYFTYHITNILPNSSLTYKYRLSDSTFEYLKNKLSLIGKILDLYIGSVIDAYNDPSLENVLKVLVVYGATFIVVYVIKAFFEVVQVLISPVFFILKIIKTILSFIFGRRKE